MKQPTTPTTPFAMRCTQEQFDDVKEELEKYREIGSIDPFDFYNILFVDDTKVLNLSENDSWLRNHNVPIVETWDKSLFLKMAGKPESESRELIGYKRNPKMDVTNEQLGKLLDCEIFEYNGFIWSGGKSWISPIPAYIRAVELNIVGEDKILVPVYREEETEIDFERELDLSDKLFGVITPPEIKKKKVQIFQDVKNGKITISECFDRLLKLHEEVEIKPKQEVRYTDEELTVMAIEDLYRLNSDEYERYNVLQRVKSHKEYFAKNNLKSLFDDKNWASKILEPRFPLPNKDLFPELHQKVLDIINSVCGGRITGTYEQQKGGE